MKKLISASLKTKIALFIAITLWASAFTGIRAGLTCYTPGVLALLRFIIASACMFILYLRLPVKSIIPWKDKILLMLIGVIGLGFYHLALNIGEMAVPAGVASFVIALSPIVTVAFAVMYLDERLHMNMIIGMIVSLSGVGLIMLSEVKHFSFDIGVCYILFAAFVGGLQTVMQKPFTKKYNAIEITAYVMYGTTLFLLMYLPDLFHQLHDASLKATGAVIYLGIFPAALGYMAWSYGLKEASASHASNYLYFMPLIATLLGLLFLGEVPTLYALLGGLIALAGVWIVNLPPKTLSAAIVGE